MTSYLLRKTAVCKSLYNDSRDKSIFKRVAKIYFFNNKNNLIEQKQTAQESLL